MKRIAILLALMLALVPGLALAEMDVSEYPVVDGSTATLPLSYAVMEHFTGVTAAEAEQAIRHSKTTESFYALVNGQADLLLVYAPSGDAFDYAKEMGVELEMQSIGRDALVFLINEDNPVASLTHEQILSVYTGQTTNWSELGGDDLPIVAYQRIENSGSQVMMKKQVMGDVEMMDAPEELRTGEMNELVNEIAAYKNTANAIGYSVYYYVHNMYMQEGIKLLSVNGVAPTNESISTGEYPYGQDFYAVIRADAPADSKARQIYDWLATAEGQSCVEAAGYVPVGQAKGE